MNKNATLATLKECFSEAVPNKEDKRTTISPLDFIVSLVFCYSGDSRTFGLDSIRRGMMGILGKSYSRSAFWERLSRARLKKMLKNVVAKLMLNLKKPIGVSKTTLYLLGVKGIRIVDSSSITLKESAEKSFPGTFTNASIKWHACFDVLSGLMTWFQLTPGNVHDSRCFPNVESLSGILVIFDLGYYDYGLLYAIQKAKGFFLSRLKSNSLIYIEKTITGLSQDVIGKKLLSLELTEKNGEIIEVLTKKEHNGETFLFRVVGFWNPLGKCYHWYITNLKASALLIYPLYRLRWQIELIFKACKRSLNASQIPSANTNIIESLLLSSIAAHLSSHTLFNIAIEEITEEEQLAISFQRVAKVSVTIAKDFAMFLLETSRENFDNLLRKIELFIGELFDPNYKRRETSLARVHGLLLSIL